MSGVKNGSSVGSASRTSVVSESSKSNLKSNLRLLGQVVEAINSQNRANMTPEEQKRSRANSLGRQTAVAPHQPSRKSVHDVYNMERGDIRRDAVANLTSGSPQLVLGNHYNMGLILTMIKSQVPQRDDLSPDAHFGGQLIKELAKRTKFDFLKALVDKLNKGNPEDRTLVGPLLEAIAAQAHKGHRLVIEALNPTQG